MKKIAIIFTAALACLCACKEKPSGEMEISHKTVTVSKSDQILLSNYNARLKGCEFVEIRPQVSGMITDICIDEGAPVKKGQVLFVIDQVPYLSALNTAEANVESVKAKLATAGLALESKKELFKADVISEYDLQTAQNQVMELKAQLAQAESAAVNARNNLSYTEVKSPVTGVASMIPYRVGSLVSSSIAKPLVTVSDISSIYAYFSLSESQILDLIRQEGSLKNVLENMLEVNLRMSNGEMYPLNGKIDAISGEVDSSTGAVSIRAIFSNPDMLLRNGAMGTIVIPTEKKDCLVIPQSATYELQDKMFAYRVVEGKAVATPIQVFRLNDGTDYIVESGLQEGDVIIAEGAGLVKDGMHVKVSEE